MLISLGGSLATNPRVGQSFWKGRKRWVFYIILCRILIRVIKSVCKEALVPLLLKRNTLPASFPIPGELDLRRRLVNIRTFSPSPRERMGVASSLLGGRLELKVPHLQNYIYNKMTTWMEICHPMERHHAQPPKDPVYRHSSESCGPLRSSWICLKSYYLIKRIFL